MAGIVNIENIGSIFSGIGDLALKVRQAITGIDSNKQAEITALIADIESKVQTAQSRINEIEAASENIFISGWRPFIGWTCGASFFFVFILKPCLEWFLIIIGHPAALPVIDISVMLPVLLGMLGLGTLRTVEKYNKLK